MIGNCCTISWAVSVLPAVTLKPIFKSDPLIELLHLKMRSRSWRVLIATLSPSHATPHTRHRFQSSWSPRTQNAWIAERESANVSTRLLRWVLLSGVLRFIRR